MFRRLSFLSIFALMFLVFIGQPKGFSQENTESQTVETKQLTPEEQFASWDGTLDSIQRALEREGLSEEEYLQFDAQAEEIRQGAQKRENDLLPRFKELTQQLEEIGPAPKEDEPTEALSAQEYRAELEKQYAIQDAGVKAAKLLVIKAEQTKTLVSQKRQAKFLNSITVKNDNVISPKFWLDFIKAHKGQGKIISILLRDTFHNLKTELTKNREKMFLPPLLFIFLSLAFIRLRKLIGAVIGSSIKIDTRFLTFTRSALLPSLYFFGAYQILYQFNLLIPRMAHFLDRTILLGSFYLMTLVILIIAYKNKDTPNGFLQASRETANKILKTLAVGLFVALVFFVLNFLAIALVSKLVISIGFSFLASLFVSGSFLTVLWMRQRDIQRASFDVANLDENLPLKTWLFLRALLWLTCIIIVISILSGYVMFGKFLSEQVIYTFVIVAATSYLTSFIDGLAASYSEHRAKTKKTDSTANPMKETLVLGSGILKLIVFITAGILLMLPWGYRTSNFFQTMKNLFFGFDVGGIRISVSAILLAFILFLVGYMITIALRNWLNDKLLPTTSLDVGTANSVSTVFGYIGFILAAIFAISAVGFDLSNLAFVAGALSVGVGFGLQSIVNNFVSGLILLVERPIKVGDWIVTAGGEGIVKKISVRSTIIETFDRAMVIVPNSSLITENVTNWTHNSKMGRVVIKVGVGYDSDVELVEELLMKIATDNPRVLIRPGPSVVFVDFGHSSLDFQLRCFLSDINNSLTLQSELRSTILKTLREHNIEIPYPQTELHFRGDMPQLAKPKSKPRTRKKN